MGFDLKKEAKFLSTRMDDKTAASVGLGAALMLVFGLLGDALTRKYNKIHPQSEHRPHHHHGSHARHEGH